MLTNGRRIHCYGGCGLLLAVARNERLMPALDAAQRYFCPLCAADPVKNKPDYGYIFRRRLQFWLASGGRNVAAEVIAHAVEKIVEEIDRMALRMMPAERPWRVAA